MIDISAYLDASQKQSLRNIYTTEVFSVMNMTHTGWGLERKATQHNDK